MKKPTLEHLQRHSLNGLVMQNKPKIENEIKNRHSNADLYRSEILKKGHCGSSYLQVSSPSLSLSWRTLSVAGNPRHLSVAGDPRRLPLCRRRPVESPNYCTTLRQAEHSAAEVALNSLSSRGPTHSLAARILDETGVYKNLLQEVSQRVGAPLPVYHSFRSGLGHLPVFTGTVELAGVTFTGEPAKNKKQAEKNAAMAAWASLKQLAKEVANTSSEQENPDELEHVTVAKALITYHRKEILAAASSYRAPSLFPEHLLVKPTQTSSLPKPPPVTSSKILPLITSKAETSRYIQQSSDGQSLSQPLVPTTPRAMSPHAERRRARRTAKSMISGNAAVQSSQPDSFTCPPPPHLPSVSTMTQAQSPESWRFPVMNTTPYVPYSQMRMPSVLWKNLSS